MRIPQNSVIVIKRDIIVHLIVRSSASHMHSKSLDNHTFYHTVIAQFYFCHQIWGGVL